MSFGNRKINHAVRVKNKGSLFAFYPYLSRTRTESVIYFSRELDVTNAINFLNEKKRSGITVSLFNLLAAAIAKTFEQRPFLNRFVLGRRLYQREIFDISYVIKKNLTDLGDEILTTVEIPKGATIDEIASKMNQGQKDLRSKEITGLDNLMNMFADLPRPIMRILFALVRFCDFHGILPSFIRSELPFYCSVFISNLGSIGVDAPFHHLYEMGTTSFFLAIGRPQLKAVAIKNGTVEVRKIVNLNFSVDERICDGYYLARSLDKFLKYMENPHTI